ncbi:MAG: hypothetical protein IH596_09250 [Bacteroidales bacterium]|nr:hypothetical protein [Bacteroidales bacterium]
MKKVAFLLLVGILGLAGEALSQDRIFTYVYQSLVLNKGQKELEIWSTYRTGRNDYYRRIDMRMEFEVGLGKRLQTAFYLNYKGKASTHLEDTLMVMNKSNAFSFSNEWKFKISDPVANAIGSAIYGEFTVGLDLFKLEAKVILDKRIGRVTQALNLVFEPEWEWEPDKDELEVETKYEIELNYGLGVDLGKGFTLGVEARNPNVYANDGGWVHSAIYVGPTFSYSTSDFWVNFTFMPQIAGLRGISNNSNLNLDEFERYQFRLMFSYIL